MIAIDLKCAEIADGPTQYQGLSRAFHGCGALFTFRFKALAAKKASPPPRGAPYRLAMPSNSERDFKRRSGEGEGN
jgi:hypothetical protein